MRLVLLFFCALLFSPLLGQSDENSSSFLNTKTSFVLQSVTKNKRPKKIAHDATFEFIKFEDRCSSEDSTISCDWRIRGSIANLTPDSIIIAAEYQEYREYNSVSILFGEKKAITGTSYMHSLQLTELDGMYYNSARHAKWKNASLNLFGASVFTTLIIAPLLSIQYKSVSEGSMAGFKRNQYFAIAGAGLTLAAVSYTCYLTFKPKYYSFAKDNYNPKKQKWRLEVAR